MTYLLAFGQRSVIAWWLKKKKKRFRDFFSPPLQNCYNTRNVKDILLLYILQSSLFCNPLCLYSYSVQVSDAIESIHHPGEHPNGWLCTWECLHRSGNIDSSHIPAYILPRWSRWNRIDNKHLTLDHWIDGRSCRTHLRGITGTCIYSKQRDKFMSEKHLQNADDDELAYLPSHNLVVDTPRFQSSAVYYLISSCFWYDDDVIINLFCSKERPLSE